jgi:pyruvate/2-oxoglutarate dehydrogenase complex dihydrolipoamide acyltransferase (E2) component
LANEEDTVTVGQDLVRLESGGTPKKTEAKESPKDDKEPPREEKKETSAPEKKSEPEQKPEPKQESKPAAPQPKQESKPAKPEPKQSEKSSQPQKDVSPFGSREERRVRHITLLRHGSPCSVQFGFMLYVAVTGQGKSLSLWAYIATLANMDVANR